MDETANRHSDGEKVEKLYIALNAILSEVVFQQQTRRELCQKRT